MKEKIREVQEQNNINAQTFQYYTGDSVDTMDGDKEKEMVEWTN